MPNIHLIATNKPSRLYEFGGQIILTNELTEAFRNQNIYITNSEKPKEGDWVITNNGLLAKVVTELTWHFINSKKIILTTDLDLIKDGVQPIDDAFLEWFVKNPSCEEVEVENLYDSDFYEIVIPKQELPQIGTKEFNDLASRYFGSPKKEKVKDLEYWKENAEEDYITTPISVLRYISELEKNIKNK